MRRVHADVLLIATAAIWGLAFVFQKTAMADIGPLTFIAARSLLAALALAPFAWFEGRNAAAASTSGLRPIILAGGVLFFLGAFLQQTGLITASVSNSGFLTALYVIFVPLIAWAWSRRAPPVIIWPAAALSFVGTWLLSGGAVATISNGDALVAISAVFWAAHVVLTGIAARRGRPFLFTCMQFVIVGLLGLAGALVFETISLTGLVRAAPEIAYVGLLSSALTFTLFNIAMRHTSAAEASIIVSAESLFGALAGAWMLGERLSAVAWTGAALIMLATLAVQIAPHWRARTAKS